MRSLYNCNYRINFSSLPPVTNRALTNTVGGEYEYIHEYRVTNTNTNIRRMAANDLKTRAPFYLIRTGMVHKLNRYQPV